MCTQKETSLFRQYVAPTQGAAEDNRDQYVEIECRSERERPKREVDAGHVSEMKGVRFRFPWRTSVASKADPAWGVYLWGKKRIEELAEEFVREVPRILLGCRWIREAVLCIDITGRSETHLWDRDFNIEELIRDPPDRPSVASLEHRHSKKAYRGERLLTLSIDELQAKSINTFLISGRESPNSSMTE